jgi:hypothetical protein
MSIYDKNGNLMNENIEFLSEKFDEICFNCNMFKSPLYDHCNFLDCCVYENHGYSTFFDKSINISNFRFLVIFSLNLNIMIICNLINIYIY